LNPSEYVKMHDLEDHYWWFVGRRELAFSLLRDSGAHRGEALVLDLGCGTGVVSQELRTMTRTVGIDFSLQALEFCRDRGLGCLVQGDAEALPFETGTFDAIVSLDVFEHLPNDEAAFRESCRVLKEGGVLILSVPAFRSLWGPHDVALHHFRRYRKREVRRKLESAGFTMVRNSYSVFLLFPLVVFSRLAEKLRRGPARASLPKVPSWLNRLLIGVQGFEARLLLTFGSLPWGSSVVTVARKVSDKRPALGSS
jgi:SAM-dependent methyltransferase